LLASRRVRVAGIRRWHEFRHFFCYLLLSSQNYFLLLLLEIKTTSFFFSLFEPLSLSLSLFLSLNSRSLYMYVSLACVWVGPRILYVRLSALLFFTRVVKRFFCLSYVEKTKTFFLSSHKQTKRREEKQNKKLGVERRQKKREWFWKTKDLISFTLRRRKRKDGQITRRVLLGARMAVRKEEQRVRPRVREPNAFVRGERQRYREARI
jgi:hypothetical protein